jgi:hypothetical protein
MEEDRELQEQFEKYTLTPFGCSECEAVSCFVTPLMGQLTEDKEPALLIECADCGSFIGCIPITLIGYEMLIRSELESIKEEKKKKKDL